MGLEKYTCRGLRFGFKFPHDSLKLPVTPVTEDKTPSYGLHEDQAGTWYQYIHQANTHIHIHT